jgi:hypothetical protein
MGFPDDVRGMIEVAQRVIDDRPELTSVGLPHTFSMFITGSEFVEMMKDDTVSARAKRLISSAKIGNVLHWSQRAGIQHQALIDGLRLLGSVALEIATHRDFDKMVLLKTTPRGHCRLATLLTHEPTWMRLVSSMAPLIKEMDTSETIRRDLRCAAMSGLDRPEYNLFVELFGQPTIEEFEATVKSLGPLDIRVIRSYQLLGNALTTN